MKIFKDPSKDLSKDPQKSLPGSLKILKNLAKILKDLAKIFEDLGKIFEDLQGSWQGFLRILTKIFTRIFKDL